MTSTMASTTASKIRFRPGTAFARAAALALAVLVGTLAYAALVRPVVDAHRRAEERIAGLRERLAQYRRTAQGREAAQALLEQHRRADRARAHYLTERNPALASAELQELVKRAVEQGRGELVSMQVIGGPRSDPADEIAVKARVRGTVSTLQRTLHALEAGVPILFVNNLSVDSALGDLVIGFDVSGHTRDPGRRGQAVSIPLPVSAPVIPGPYEEIVARSVFAPTRRTAPEKLEARLAAPEARELTVIGVLIAGERKLALVREAGRDRDLRVRPGDGVGEWTLADVRADSVTLRNGTQTRVLPVQRAPAVR